MDARELHRALFKAVESHDIAQLRELYAPDYEYRGFDGETADIEAGIAVAETFTAAFPDLSFEIEHQWAPSATVSVVEFRASGTHSGALGELPATGKRASVVGCNIIESRDGKVVREREYADMMTLMRQLGVIE